MARIFLSSVLLCAYQTPPNPTRCLFGSFTQDLYSAPAYFMPKTYFYDGPGFCVSDTAPLNVYPRTSARLPPTAFTPCKVCNTNPALIMARIFLSSVLVCAYQTPPNPTRCLFGSFTQDLYNTPAYLIPKNVLSQPWFLRIRSHPTQRISETLRFFATHGFYFMQGL